MSRFLLICFGGAIGTGARYLVSGFPLRVVPVLDERIADGLVTLEKVRVLEYSAGQKR